MGRGHPDGSRVSGQAGGGGHPVQPHLPDRERQRGGDGHLHQPLQTKGDGWSERSPGVAPARKDGAISL